MVVELLGSFALQILTCSFQPLSPKWLILSDALCSLKVSFQETAECRQWLTNPVGNCNLLGWMHQS